MRLINKFQMGGEVATPETEVPVEETQGMPQENGQDPMTVIVQLFAEGLQTQNCEELAQGAQMFLELVQQAQSQQPVFAKGGRLVRR